MVANTRSDLLAEAERLIRQGGYSAFSYADLANKIGITKASIHYHFPSKQRLAEEVAEQAIARFVETLARIEGEEAGALARLRLYSQLFLEGFDDNLRPLCCALSSELVVLPESIQKMTTRYFNVHIEWLTRVVEAGIAQGELRWPGTAQDLAKLLLTTLEGGSLLARAHRNEALLFAGFDQVIAQL